MPSQIIQGRTEDTAGNVKLWRMTGTPGFCDDARIQRRLIARHVALFATQPNWTSWCWGPPSVLDAA